MISRIANLVYELPHELPNDLRLRILGNKKMLVKSQIWVETQPSTQSPFQKLNFGSSSQKTRKSRYQTFLVLSSFTGFLYFVPNILARIVNYLIFHLLQFSNFLIKFLINVFLDFLLPHIAHFDNSIVLPSQVFETFGFMFSVFLLHFKQ